MSAEQAREAAATSYDGYLNALYRSLRVSPRHLATNCCGVIDGGGIGDPSASGGHAEP